MVPPLLEPAHMHAAIRTQNLSRRFGERTAVDAISLCVPARSIYGFLGRNGAGKTTTIKLLLGLLRPDAGQIWIDGIDVSVDRIAAARRIGALLEAHGFYAHLSGHTNLELARRLLCLPATEVDRVLEIVGLSAHGRRRVSDYSLGMRQRLGLARALLGAPPVLLLDEPTNGLDPEGIAEMRELLRELPTRTGATVLVSSHLLAEVEQVASHVGILNEGRLVLEGALQDLRARLDTEVCIETEHPERATEIARGHGYALIRDGDALIARFPAGTDHRSASAALNRALCLADVPVHRLATRQLSLEILYHRAAQQAGLPQTTLAREASP